MFTYSVLLAAVTMANEENSEVRYSLDKLIIQFSFWQWVKDNLASLINKDGVLANRDAHEYWWNKTSFRTPVAVNTNLVHWHLPQCLV